MRILKCSLEAGYLDANFPPPRAFVLERESNRTLMIDIHYSHPLIQRPLFPMKGPQIQLQRLEHCNQCHKKVVITTSFVSEQYQTKALHLYSPLTDQVFSNLIAQILLLLYMVKITSVITPIRPISKISNFD